MALGTFRFSVNSAAYESLRHAVQYRWSTQDRLGRLPARQYTGPGTETISLVGVIYPYAADQPAATLVLDQLRAQAGQGLPLLLTDGRGRVWGRWCVENIEETRSVFFADGSPRKIEFSLALAIYGEDS